MKLTEMTHRNQIGLVLNALGLTGFAAEIGVAYAENALDIMDKWEGKGLFLIDPYKKWLKDEYIDGSSKIDFEGALEYAFKHIKAHLDRCMWMRMTSDAAYEVLSKMPLLDFVYLDGNHHQPQIGRDIENYWKLVRPGGILGGHDYYNLNETYYHCDVETVINSFADKNDVELHVTPECTSWWIRKI